MSTATRYRQQNLIKIQLQMHPMANTCLNCAHRLSGQSASSLHCGESYFRQPAGTRKPMRLDHYPVVSANHTCPRWTSHHSGVLSSVAAA